MPDIGQVLGQLAAVGVELPLDLLAAADVPEAAAEHAGAALGVGLDGKRLAQPDDPAPGGHHAVLELAPAAVAQAAGPPRHGQCPVLGVDDLGPELRIVEPAIERIGQQLLGAGLMNQ